MADDGVTQAETDSDAAFNTSQVGVSADDDWVKQAQADIKEKFRKSRLLNKAVHLLGEVRTRDITDEDVNEASKHAKKALDLDKDVSHSLFRLTEEVGRLEALRTTSPPGEFESFEDLEHRLAFVVEVQVAANRTRDTVRRLAAAAQKIAVKLRSTLKNQINPGSTELTNETAKHLGDIADHLAVFVKQEYGQIHSPVRRLVTPLDKMREIEHINDLDLRSQLVTLGFFDLGRVILGYTHTDSQPGSTEELFQKLGVAGDTLVHEFRGGHRHDPYLDANFCAFACWAAVTIGQPIRNRFAPRRIDSDTPNMVRGLASRLAIDVRQTNGQRLSRLLSEAQVKVFVDVRKAFVSLLDMTDRLEKELSRAHSSAVFHSQEASYDEQRETLEKVRKIEAAVTELDGRGLAGVRQARDSLGQAAAALVAKVSPLHLGEIDNAAVALDFLDQCEKHLSTLGEVQQLAIKQPSGQDLTPRYQSIQHGMISLFLARYAFKHCHEDVKHKVRSELIFRSTLLIESYIQTVVQTVLTYSVDELARDYLDEQIGIESSENRGAGRWRRRFNRTVAQGFDQRLDQIWGRFLTDQVLVARIGDEVIRLGRDIPDPPGNHSGFFPDALRDIDDQWTHNLLLRFDHSFGAGVGTRSFKWGDYDDRMNFMTNLFRSRQTELGVWKEPFTLREEIQVRIGVDPTEGASLPWMR